MICNESGWCLAEAIAFRLRDRVVARPWSGFLLVIPNHAMVVQGSFWREFGRKGGWLHFPLRIQFI